jgi:hypothetical protein
MAGLKIANFNPAGMTPLLDDVTGIDFGDTIRGQHSTNVVAIRPAAHGITLTALALFLENTSGVDHSEFGRFKSSTPITGIEPGSDYLSDYFIPITGISDASQIGEYSDYGIVFNATTPEYAWLDAEAGTSETMMGDSTVNFRFVFEYD